MPVRDVRRARRPRSPRSPFRRRAGTAAALVLSLALALPAPPAALSASAAQTAGTVREPPAKRPVATGYGGAVSSVDPYASRAGLEVLRAGGNAVDAAVATEELLSERFAEERACLIDPGRALNGPPAPADPRDPDSWGCSAGQGGGEDHEGPSTTHLVTADRWGDVVSYTLTIERTGGSAITVPGRGFLLNNELTDFDFTPVPGEVAGPNLPGPGKRPRSSMAPTIVLEDGRPLLALGSPGGSTIITTVLQTLVNRIDLGMTLPEAVAAPRLSQRNTTATLAEPAFLEYAAERAPLERLGHRFALPPPAFTPSPEIGAVAALEVLPDGRVRAVAEPERRGGGSAMVVRPSRR